MRARRPVPRWEAALALLAIGGIYLVVSDAFSVGPPPTTLALAVAGIALLGLSRRWGPARLAHWTARAVLTLVTVAVAVSAVFLVYRLPQAHGSGTELLLDAAFIWVANVLSFALWYWEIDGGGPAQRRMEHHVSSDLVFPQMTLLGDGSAGVRSSADRPWAPRFLDYLFFAFNVGTSFSPADTMVLSHRAKLLVMAQSLLSLMVVAVLAARAINVL